MNRLILISIFCIIFPVQSFAAPLLNFSDFTSGPDTGLGDSLGSGMIVTVWGNRLGSSQGSSKIYFTDSAATKREAAYVYYWKNADGELPGGPANLYATHEMQEIAFSIPDSATGAGTITVEVGGVESNSLPFTVRAGTVYYISDAGNNTTGNGSYASPWKSLSYYDSPAGVSAKAGVVAGDTIYSLGTVRVENEDIRDKAGTESAPISVSAYPNATYSITTTSEGSAITNYYPYGNSWWNFSKVTIATEISGISVGTGWRAVGNEITDTTCANGQGGAITAAFGKGGNTKSFGNYIHDFGCPTTSTLHHVFYVSNRSKSTVLGTDANKYSCKVSHTSSAETSPGVGANWETYWEASTISSTPSGWVTDTAYVNGVIPAFELGWNRLEDNDARNGLHVYDEGVCGDYSGTITVHNNFVRNQAGASISVGTLSSYQASDCLTMDVDIYNNILISGGNPPHTAPDYSSAGIQIYGNRFTGNVDVSNNTIVDTPADMTAVAVYGSGYTEAYRYGGTWTYQNNIVIDTNDAMFEPEIVNKTPTTSTNNIWYNGGDSVPASVPAWDTTPITDDPLLGTGYKPVALSPAVNAGLALVPTDFYGVSRTVPDIGAAEYSAFGQLIKLGGKLINSVNTAP